MFNAINHILFNKSGKEATSDILSEFSPYMVSRYLSFYDNDLVVYTNETINRYHNLFEDSLDNLKFYEKVVPKLKKKKIEYIKAPKKELKEVLEEYPVPEFLSKREMNLYFELFDK